MFISNINLKNKYVKPSKAQCCINTQDHVKQGGVYVNNIMD